MITRFSAFLLCIVSLFAGLVFGFSGGVYSLQDDIEAVRNIKLYQPITYSTGKDVWDEANKYRVSLGLQPLILDEALCNNISARAINYKKTNSHNGLTDHIQTYIGNRQVAEILNYGQTAVEIVNGWKNSPSHNLYLTTRSKGCAYSSQGYSVILLSY